VYAATPLGQWSRCAWPKSRAGTALPPAVRGVHQQPDRVGHGSAKEDDDGEGQQQAEPKHQERLDDAPGRCP
jgi:hypothetical protein